MEKRVMPVLRFLTAGESHGPEISVIVEGFPAGVAIDRAELDREMSRRQKGHGTGGRMKIEKDQVQITSGIVRGQTTGAPITIRIPNLDYVKWRSKDIDPMTIPRPGHADLTGAIKYGYRDLRLSLERASARETAARVAAGALCKQYLGKFKIVVGSYVASIGTVRAQIPAEMSYRERFSAAETSDVRCPVPEAAQAMRQHIDEISRRDWEAMYIGTGAWIACCCGLLAAFTPLKASKSAVPLTMQHSRDRRCMTKFF
jgi:chorismate synthase